MHDSGRFFYRVTHRPQPHPGTLFVFVSEAGTPLIPSNLRRLVSTLASDAGIEGTVTPYALRHTATSLLSASGVAPELLADLLGRVDPRMVHKHYRHPVTPTISVARDHIEDAL